MADHDFDDAPLPGAPGSAQTTKHPADVIALCLSGGGYRAMLFHVGALWRLHETGHLQRVACVSSVSGGSIANAWLALCWRALTATGADFDTLYVRPIRELAGHTMIGVAGIIAGLLAGSVSARVAAALDDALLGGRTLQDLPDAPQFIFAASNLQSGALWSFSKVAMGDYKVGRIIRPDLRLSQAVAASAAFPPLLSPMILSPRVDRFVPTDPGPTVTDPRYRARVVLTDGGVYDNLGLEPVIKRARSVLVSDGGAPFAVAPAPWAFWPTQLIRVLKCEDNQVRSLRKRDLIGRYRLYADLAAAGIDLDSAASCRELARTGTYWGIHSHVSDYPSAPGLPCPPDQVERLARIATTLSRLPEADQERLINWGYAACDYAIRAHINTTAAPPAKWRYPRGLD